MFDVQSRNLRALCRSLECDPDARRRVQSKLPPGNIHYANCQFLVHPADNFTEYQLWLNGTPPEHEATMFLRNKFSKREIVMVDVGANAGIFSIPIVEAASKKSMFILFEPSGILRDRLMNNLKLNGISNVKIMDNAIGDEAAHLTLYYPSHLNLGQARLYAPYSSSKNKTLNIPVRTLPDCLRELKIMHVDLLKVDIEGSEDRAILPLLRDKIVRNPQYIYFEYKHDSHWGADLYSEMKSNGYRIVQDFEPNALFEAC